MEDQYKISLPSHSTLIDEKSHPNHWRNRAADLKASAGALWYAMGSEQEKISQTLGYSKGYRMDIACWPVYHMLCGLSLELIMKAVLVQQAIPQKKIETHSLHKLHLLTGIKIDDRRKKLLDFYESSVVWAGRYPVPRNPTSEKLLSYYNLQSEILTEPFKMESFSTLNFRISSDTTDWIKFSKIWNEYDNLFI